MTVDNEVQTVANCKQDKQYTSIFLVLSGSFELIVKYCGLPPSIAGPFHWYTVFLLYREHRVMVYGDRLFLAVRVRARSPSSIEGHTRHEKGNTRQGLRGTRLAALAAESGGTSWPTAQTLRCGRFQQPSLRCVLVLGRCLHLAHVLRTLYSSAVGACLAVFFVMLTRTGVVFFWQLLLFSPRSSQLFWIRLPHHPPRPPVVHCLLMAKQANTGICFNCGSSKHALRACSRPRQKDGSLPHATCFVCKDKGHISAHCKQNANGIYPKGGFCKVRARVSLAICHALVLKAMLVCFVYGALSIM